MTKQNYKLIIEQQTEEITKLKREVAYNDKHAGDLYTKISNLQVTCLMMGVALVPTLINYIRSIF